MQRNSAASTSLKEKGRVTKGTLLDRPTQEARERTFQADSLAAKAMVGLRDAANKFGITDKAGGTLGLGDIAIPFAGVPANLSTQTAKFSPPGLVNGIKDLARVIAQARKGTLNPALQAQAVNNIGKGLTGTIGIAMATVLAIKGIISVAGSDDKKQRSP